MKQLKYERIDKGVKRDKRQDRPHAANGDFLPACSPEQKEIIINDAVTALAKGEITDQIAARHGIDGSTLRRWLLTDDRADHARKLYFDSELSNARDEIKTSSDAFTLARAREDFRAIGWIAERRQAEYSLKQEVKHTGNVGPIINIQLSAAPQLVQDSNTLCIEQAAQVPDKPEQS